MLKMAIAFILLLSTSLLFSQQTITLGTTHTTVNSGLMPYLLEHFQKETAINVRTVVGGSGYILKLASRGDVDIIIVHDEEGEQHFISEHKGTKRYPLMKNYFVLVGPKKLPNTVSLASLLMAIANAQYPFISRGDASGTHKRELALWSLLPSHSQQKQDWYKVAGLGMGATLNMAAALNAYTLSDIGTWRAFNNKATLEVVYEGPELADNHYSILSLNYQQYPHINQKAVERLKEWLLSEEGQRLINAYRIQGEQVFWAN